VPLGDTLKFIPLGCDIGLKPAVVRVARQNYAAVLEEEGAENSEQFLPSIIAVLSRSRGLDTWIHSGLSAGTMWSLSIVAVLLISTATAIDVAQEAPMYSRIYSQTSKIEAAPGRKRVAVIGGGIAGSSVAYRLHDEYQHLPTLDITVYETTFQAGGRMNSTWVDDGAEGYTGFVETGAQVFSADDLCIQAAIDGAGLRRQVILPWWQSRSAGVWNGRELILRRHWDLKSRTWQDFVRDTWKYGTSPYRLRKLLEDKLPRFRELYGEHSYINPNLLDVIQRLGLAAESEQSAEDYLLENGISAEFLQDIIQPTVRASYAHDLGDLNGLSALVAMNPSAVYRIGSGPRGNWELVLRLLRLSEAQILLNSRVTKISRSAQGKYTVTASVRNIPQDDTHDMSTIEEGNEYDLVVIATNLKGAGIQFDFPMSQTYSALTPFVERHVTLVTSPIVNTLSPRYFNPTTTAEIPDMIFTTHKSESGPGREIFSIEWSWAATRIHGDVIKGENLYKITSAEPIPDSIIAKMFGKSPDTPLDSLDIRWIHRQVWPLASPKRTRGPQLDNIELADGLFYTGIGEELVSSIEMSCRMGRQVADMIYRKLRYPKWSIPKQRIPTQMIF
jgi:glycine/D-amino acid oxidase-like deaminating enzyme